MTQAVTSSNGLAIVTLLGQVSDLKINPHWPPPNLTPQNSTVSNRATSLPSCQKRRTMFCPAQGGPIKPVPSCSSVNIFTKHEIWCPSAILYPDRSNLSASFKFRSTAASLNLKARLGVFLQILAATFVFLLAHPVRWVLKYFSFEVSCFCFYLMIELDWPLLINSVHFRFCFSVLTSAKLCVV